MSPPHAHALDVADESASHTASNALNTLDMEHDTCSVCTSKCICTAKSNTASVLSAVSSNSSNTSVLSPTNADMTDPFTSTVPPPSSVHPSLKIKLTMPSKLSSSYSPTIPKFAKSRGHLKKKSKSVGNTTFAEGNGAGPSISPGSPVSATAALGRSSSLTAGPSSLQKKRGRPSKAVVAARQAVRSQQASLSGTTNFSDAGHASDPATASASITHVSASRPQKKITSAHRSIVKGKASASKIGKKVQKKAASTSRTKGRQRKLGESSQAAHRKKIIHVLDDESSDLSELDSDEDFEPYGLPTFVAAISSSSNPSSSGSDSDAGTDSSDSNSGSNTSSNSRGNDTSIGEDVISQHKRGHHHNRNVRMRRRESGSVGFSDADMATTDSDAEEEQSHEEDIAQEGEVDDNDGEIEDLGYPQLRRYSGIATGFTDDEESSFDADIFFANLSETESSAYVSDDEQMGDAENGFGDEDGQEEEEEETDAMDIELGSSGFDVMRLSEMAAAGFLAPLSDLEREASGPSWDQLISSSMREQMPNLDARQAREVYLSSTLEMTIPGYKEAEAMMATSEEEEAVAMFDLDDCSLGGDQAEQDGLEIFEGSDGGDTTEDELVDVDGIATPRHEVLLRFPASLGTIDPMSTVSSPIKIPSKSHNKPSRKLSDSKSNSAREKRKLKKKKRARRPSDILSGKVFEDSEKENVDASSSPHAPPMGSFFHRPAEQTKSAVISVHRSADEPIPCPYPIARRARRGRGGSLSALSHSGSDRSFLSRPSSFLGAQRTPYEPTVQPSIEETDDTDSQMRDPIRLDDVFDTTFLEPAPSDAPAPPDSASTILDTDASDSERRQQVDNFQRWDRVPINAFRTRQSTSTLVDLGLPERTLIARTPHAPRPSDGFSYGSAAGGMLRGSPFANALWESGSPTGKDEQARAAAMDKMSSLLLSPALLPPRDDNATPTADMHRQKQEQDAAQQLFLGFETPTLSTQSQNQHQQHQAANLKSRKEMRKEKKHKKKFSSGPPHRARHNHFPNAKGRASGSMQRTASMPSLGI